jgi:hypothetical protein
LISSAIAAWIVARVAWRLGYEAGLISLVACGGLLSLIWFSEWWTTYVLPFGWHGILKPSDLDSPAYVVILPVFGWVVLLGFAVIVW